MRKTVILLVLILSVFITNSLFAQDAQEIIRKVQSKYKGIKDAKAGFSLSVKPKSGKSQSSTGTIYIQKEKKYRIESKDQVSVTDGVTTWSYSAKKKQVIIDNYKDNGNTFSPNKYLFDYPENFYSDLDDEETISGKECYVLKLSPRSKSTVKSAKIWVDKEENLIRKIYIVTNESSTTYTLKNITLDPGLSSSKFTFSTPSGVEEIDLR
ncbi:MAG TPA: outer membrane lipoprotein carrier protein LolA [Ignavibacteria bacterium]